MSLNHAHMRHRFALLIKLNQGSYINQSINQSIKIYFTWLEALQDSSIIYAYAELIKYI